MFKLKGLLISFLTIILQIVSLMNLANSYTEISQKKKIKIAMFDQILLKSCNNNDEREKYQLIHKINLINDQNQKINYHIVDTADIKNNQLFLLASQSINVHNYPPKNYFTLSYSSILTPKFWAPLIKQQSTDKDKIYNFFSKIYNVITFTWGKKWIYINLIWIIISIFVINLGRLYSEKIFIWISIHKISKGHLRRSFFAVAVMISTLFIIVISFNFIACILMFNPSNNDAFNIQDFIDRLVQLSVYYGLIVGLGRIYFLSDRPSWSLQKYTSKNVIFTLKPLLPVITIIVFIIQIVESFNYSVNTSLSITMFLNGLISLLISTTGLIISLIINRIKQKKLNIKIKYQNPAILYCIQIFLALNSIIILFSLIIGYITLALFLSYEMIWCIILFALYYLFSIFIDDICQAIFIKQNPFVSRIKTYLNLTNQNFQQAEILISAVSKILLILFLCLLLFNGIFALSTPMDFIHKIIEFWNGKGLETLNIIPAHIFHAFLFMIIGIYILFSVTYWLKNKFFPKTNMDIGLQVSLLTLFRNIGYVVIIILTLSIIGLQWNKLAWIVSALSVGIGFGLQEIVKNFISGLILLTERPVRVGDLVSINGIEGDIRRINVRATEIQLHDKSTLIVPNSHLISQNVRNATMDCAQGLVTITLTFPLDIDPIKVREILLNAYKKSERILLKPEPSVSFKELMPNGIVLSVTGNVLNQRYISITKSDLLFNILLRLRKENIQLSSPQTLIIKN